MDRLAVRQTSNFQFYPETNFHQTELRPLPQDWHVVRLGEVADIDWGNTSLTKASYQKFGYPAFSAAGMDGYLDFFEHEGEAIIVSAIGARCGKYFYFKGQFSAIKNTIIVKGKKKLYTQYACFYLNDEKNGHIQVVVNLSPT